MSRRPCLFSGGLPALSGIVLLAACGGGGGEGGGTEQPSNLTAPQPSVGLGLKQFRFSWDAVQGADRYRVLEDVDGRSGLRPIWEGVQTAYSHVVPLYGRLEARYVVEACDRFACAQSDEWRVTGTLVDAVGYVKASNPATWNRFGQTVVLSDDGKTMLVAAQGAGSVYAFSENGGTWSQAQLIDALTPAGSDAPSLNVTLSGNGQIIAAFADGVIRMFERDIGGWQPRETIVVDPAQPVPFRVPIFLSEDGATLAAGVNGDAYIYERLGEGWTLQTSLNGKGDNLALSADGKLLAAAGHAASAFEIFSYDSGVWSLQSSVPLEVGFAPVFSFADQGQMLAVGVSEESSAAQGIDGNEVDNSAYKAGAVFVYRRSGQIWARDAYLKASNAQAYDRFGYAIDLSTDGTVLVVGAYGEDGSARGLNGVQDDAAGPTNSDGGSAGAAYVFTRGSAAWKELAYLKATNTRSYAEYGRSVAVSGNGAVIAVGDDYESSASAGVGQTTATTVRTRQARFSSISSALGAPSGRLSNAAWPPLSTAIGGEGDEAESRSVPVLLLGNTEPGDADRGEAEIDVVDDLEVLQIDHHDGLAGAVGHKGEIAGGAGGHARGSVVAGQHIDAAGNVEVIVVDFEHVQRACAVENQQMFAVRIEGVLTAVHGGAVFPVERFG